MSFELSEESNRLMAEYERKQSLIQTGRDRCYRDIVSLIEHFTTQILKENSKADVKPHRDIVRLIKSNYKRNNSCLVEDSMGGLLTIARCCEPTLPDSGHLNEKIKTL